MSAARTILVGLLLAGCGPAVSEKEAADVKAVVDRWQELDNQTRQALAECLAVQQYNDEWRREQAKSKAELKDGGTMSGDTRAERLDKILSETRRVWRETRDPTIETLAAQIAGLAYELSNAPELREK